MLDRFTERARWVVVLATEEARRRNHPVVAPEHLLLAIVRDREGMAVAALQRRGILLDPLQAELERALAGSPDVAPGGEPSFSAGTKRVLELAVRWVGRLCHRYVGTETLLLGLIEEGESPAARVLASLGATLDVVRGEVDVLIGAQIQPSDENLRLIKNSRWRFSL